MGLISKLTPVCRITGGSNTAATIQERLISCTVVDAAGLESDSISIQIEAGGLMEWPRTGQVIGCEMGYREDDSVTALGQFKLCRISENLSPNTLTLTGTAAPFHASDETELKQARSHTWFNTSVGEVVRTIANRHGFSPRVHPELDGLPVLHLDQTEEPDLKFLTRLAGLHDAVCKPVDSLLVFARRGQVKTLTGRTLKPITIKHSGNNQPGTPAYVSGSITGSDRQQYNGEPAHWYDGNGVIEMTEQAGQPPRKRLPARYESRQSALSAIQAEMRRIDRQGDKLQLDCPGNPSLAAEGLLTLEGFPSGRMAGQWSLDRVTHTYNGAYRCNVEATRPTRA